MSVRPGPATRNGVPGRPRFGRTSFGRTCTGRAAGRTGTVRATAARWVHALAFLLAASPALGHPMLVIGDVSFSPDPPGGSSATVTLTLSDTSLTEVEDAVILLELREGAPLQGAAMPAVEPFAVTDELTEVAAGVYRTQLPLPSQGVHTLTIRDRTYRQEEAIANVEVRLDGEAVGAIPFVLPPTATGPASLGSWLIWLVGVPLLAGIVVTVLVLRSGRADTPAEAQG